MNLARLKERVEKVIYKSGDWKVDGRNAIDFMNEAPETTLKLISAIEILSAACESIAQSEYTFGERTDFTEEAYEAQEALKLAAKKLESL